MTPRPSIGEMLLGIEGLALLRLASTDQASARAARVSEIRALLRRMDEADELGRTVEGVEHDLVDGYRLWSETYDTPLRLFPLENPVMHGLFDTLPPSVVLDAACGTGRHGAYLAARGHRIVGIDLSRDMLARARPKVAGGFVQASLTELPLARHSVDAVVCALALVHLPHVRDAVGEFARVLRPGGRVIISDVHPFVIMLGWQAQFRSADGTPGFMPLHPHLPSEYCAAFAAVGLRVRTCHEPLLTPASAVTVAAERLPDANLAAFVGLPGVVIWDLEKDR